MRNTYQPQQPPPRPYNHPSPPRHREDNRPPENIPKPRPGRAGMASCYTENSIVIRFVNFPKAELAGLETVVRRRWLRQIWAGQDGEAYTITLNVRFRDSMSWDRFQSVTEQYLHVQQAMMEWLHKRGWIFEHVMAARSRMPSISERKFHKNGQSLRVLEAKLTGQMRNSLSSPTAYSHLSAKNG